MNARNVSLAIVHYPVYNKNREIIATCLSSYDIHDISRSSRCYGIDRLFFINPMETQHNLAERIINHWIDGHGAVYNPTRQEALQLIDVKKNISDVKMDIEKDTGKKPYTIVTSSRYKRECINFHDCKQKLADPEQQYLILFGTGWGLSDEIIEQADFFLEPIMGHADFNHLSVRSASAIVLDRLFGDGRNGGCQHVTDTGN